MERISTEGLPHAGRMAAWTALYSSRLSTVHFEPADRAAFDAELRVGQFGPMTLARLSLDRCVVERAPRHISRSGPRFYNLLLQAEGSSTFHHFGRCCDLDEGDFVLVDTGMPHHFVAPTNSVTVLARMRADLLRKYMPLPEQLCGVHLSRKTGMAGPAAAMMKALTESGTGDVGTANEGRVARCLLEMISMSYGACASALPQGSAVVDQRRNEVIRYIENNLRDPELTPAAIACGLRVSPRHLRAVFTSTGETMSSYILRRRLEECGRQIRDPMWRGNTLTAIAFAWGFNSAAHFTRCFRDQFGIAPREYRNAALVQ